MLLCRVAVLMMMMMMISKPLPRLWTTTKAIVLLAPCLSIYSCRPARALIVPQRHQQHQGRLSVVDGRRRHVRHLPAAHSSTRNDVEQPHDPETLRQLQQPQQKSFLDWAKEHAVPLTCLEPNDDMTDFLDVTIGQALNRVCHKRKKNNKDSSAVHTPLVVVLSEPCHNGREILSLHHRMVRYLVQRHGFQTIVTETGLPESRLIWDYVQQPHTSNASSSSSSSARSSSQQQETIDTVYRKGLVKFYSEWQEGRALIEWIREHNHHHQQQQQQDDNIVHYYGCDIGGFYDDWKLPLSRILAFIQKVDGDYAQDLTKALEPFVEIMGKQARINYTTKLDRVQQSMLAVLLDDLVFTLEGRRKEFVQAAAVAAASSNLANVSKKEASAAATAVDAAELEYEWASQSAKAMRFAENYFQNLIQRYDPPSSKFVGLNGREIAMHSNILWMIEQAQRRRRGRRKGGDDSNDNDFEKIVLIDHVIHTKTESQYQDEVLGFFTPACQMLRQSLGKDNVFVIGMVYGGGQFWEKWQLGPTHRTVSAVPPYRPDGLEDTLGRLPHDNFFLYWDQAKGTEAQPWLDSLHSMRENDYFINICPREWNACIFLKQVSAATPLVREKGQD